MHYLRIITTVFILVFLSCKEESPTEPENKEEILASEVIGIGGGSIEYEDILISIPPGSFQSEHEIKILRDESIHPDFNQIYSPIYVIDGIPSAYFSPIEINIKSSVIENGEPVIAVGEEVFSRAQGNTTRAYYFLKSIDNGDYITADLPATDDGFYKGSGIDEEETKIPVMVAARVANYTTAQGHFQIDVEGSSISILALEALGSYLEEAYTYFQSIGFDYSARDRWPMSVLVTPDQKNYGEYSNSRLGNNFGFMELSTTDIQNALTDAEVKRTAGHEFFHFVQSLYDPRNRISKAVLSYDWYWFDEASGTWAEEKFTEDSGYISDNFKQNLSAQFNGIQKGEEIDDRKHGYGMTSFVKYLTTEFGNEILADIYEQVLNGKSILNAVFNETYTKNELLPNFFTSLIRGEIYNVGQGFWRGNFSQDLTITNETELPRVFQDNYPDFGLKNYKVSISDPQAKESDILKATTSNPNTYIIAMKSFGGGQWVNITNDHGKVLIQNVKQLNDERAVIYFFVLNLDAYGDYTGTDDIAMSVDIEGSQFSECSVHIGFSIYAEEKSKTDPNDVSQGYTTVLMGEEFAGSLSENVFTGTSTYQDGDLSYTGTISVNFSEDLSKILAFTLTESYGRPESSPAYSWTENSIHIRNLDGGPTLTQSYEYIVEGNSVCNYVEEFNWERETATHITTFLSLFCNEFSSIRIELY
ncbi:MAG: hypothetical protein PHW27_09040 [Melioribacteraceae bacterium]|nr:hypothetical protein [Melioribacteraceae bacterium]